MKKSFYWSVAFIAALVFAGVYSTNVLAQEGEPSDVEAPAPIVEETPTPVAEEETEAIVEEAPVDEPADEEGEVEGASIESPKSSEVETETEEGGTDFWATLSEEDATDGDFDDDGVADEDDNCLIVANKDQADENADNIGDVCEDAGFEAGSVEEEAPIMMGRFAFPSDPDVTLCHYDDGSYETVLDTTITEVIALLHGILPGHDDDIIPPFNFGFLNILLYSGKNWDAEGQAIYNNGCKVPAPVELDFGDAPDPGHSYPTRLVSDGARHVIVPGVYLGASIDAETDVAPASDALEDDSFGTDDEDGVMITSSPVPCPTNHGCILVSGTTATIEVTASVAGYVDAWVDWSTGGVFEPTDRIFNNQPVVAGVNELTFPVPVDGNASNYVESFLRVRFHTTDGALLPNGLASDGEVEDYQIAIRDWCEPGQEPGTDYSCIPLPPQSCTLTVVSDDVTEVSGNETFLVTPPHPSWTSIAMASWIWNVLINGATDDAVVGPVTFTRDFVLDGIPTSASFDISADNGYTVKLNGNSVCNDPAEQNWSSVDNCSINLAWLNVGSNTLEIVVDNYNKPDGYTGPNPGGLLYKLVLNGQSQEACEEPEPQDETTTVTICKYEDATDTDGLSDWTVMLLGEKADDVEVLPDGNGYSSIALDAGSYVLLANGEYVYRPGDAAASTSDAAYSLRLPSDGYSGPDDPWYRVNDFPFPYSGWLGIMNNDDSLINWGSSFNPAHEYAAGTTTSTTTPLSFKILDDQYGDNSGSLTVDIYEGYVGVTEKDGCVTFEDVPFGEYALDEIMQDGWSFVESSADEAGMVTVDEQNNQFYIVNEDGENEAPICDPRDNLIENASFEDPIVTGNGGDWELFFSGITGWVADFVADGNDAPLEVQAGYSGWTAADGNQYVELDSTAPTIVSQDVPTIPGQTYQLTYKRAARPGTATGENAVEAQVNGVMVDTSVFGVPTGNPDWFPSPLINFVATTSTTTISFKDIAPSADSLGTFIDDVALYCVLETPEDTSTVTICKHEDSLDGDLLGGWTVWLEEYFPVVYKIVDEDTHDFEGVTASDGEDFGCVTFNNVPYGDYDLGEDMQPGWEFVSSSETASDSDHVTVNDGTESFYIANSDEDGGGNETDETVVVTPSLLNVSGTPTTTDWYFFDDVSNLPSTSEVAGDYEFVSGPAGAGLFGTGSVQMSVVGVERFNIATNQFAGIDLDQIGDMNFQTYQPSSNPGASSRAIYFHFDVDFNNAVSTGYQGRLVFVPADEHAVLEDAWQTHDASNGGAGMWRWSGYDANGSKWPDNDTDALRSWSEIVSVFPDAEIYNETFTGQLLFRAGEPYADGFTGAVDKFVIEVGTHTTTYNFEPEAQVESCLVEGYKYDEEGNPLEGWYIGLEGYYYPERTRQEIVIYEEQLIGSDVTDENGYYCIPGEVRGEGSNYSVYEIIQEGWDNIGAEIDGDEVSEYYDNGDIASVEIGYLGDGMDVNFINQYEGPNDEQCSDEVDNDNDEAVDENDSDCQEDTPETPNDDDDDNGRPGSNRNSFRGRGEVLGATTETNFCPFLRDYQHINTKNDPAEVNKAKAFFNAYLGMSLPLDGTFDMPMFNAVVQFQNMFKPDVLDTWTEEFPSLNDNATGYLYQTTKWKINSIICPGYETFPDQLIMAPGTTI